MSIIDKSVTFQMLVARKPLITIGAFWVLAGWC